MTTLLLGGGLLARGLFKYNRKGFMFDKKMRQERHFQAQDMRLEQFALYREDIRDLYELTCQKMDNYLVAAALLLDKTVLMTCKMNEALPEDSPPWATALNAMSLASAILYFLIALWLALYASVSAQSFGTRLLTQFVRLPYATEEQMATASSAAADYEGRNVWEMIRMPVVQDKGPGTRDDDAPPGPSGAPSNAQGTLGATSAAGMQASLNLRALPSSLSGLSTDLQGPTFMRSLQAMGTQNASVLQDPSIMGDPRTSANHAIRESQDCTVAMLEHIRLYRAVQLNWQAFDAYARVSLFAGTTSLLYCCLYWCLGVFLKGDHAALPAISTAFIFSTVQVMLSRLDLRLRRKHLLLLTVLMGTMPVVTTIGMLVWKDGKGQLSGLTRFLNELCALVAHALHTISVGLLIKAAWPAPTNTGDAKLPQRFRSVLYLDVFGWLVNPGGPDAANQDDDHDDDSGEDETPQTETAATQPIESTVLASSASSSTAALTAPVPQEVSMEEFSLTLPAIPSSSQASPALSHMQTMEVESANQAVSPGRARLDRRSTFPRERAVTNSDSPRSERSPRFADDSVRHQQSSDSVRHQRSSQSITRQLPADGRERSRSTVFTRHNSKNSITSLATSSASVPGSRSRVELSANVAAHALALLHPDGDQSTTPSENFGGHESIPLPSIARVTVPTPTTAANFTPIAPPASTAERVRKVDPPGEVPWRAFCHASFAVWIMWCLSTLWTAIVMLSPSGWHGEGNGALQSQQLESVMPMDVSLNHALCTMSHTPFTVRRLHAGQLEAFAADGWMPHRQNHTMRIRDAGCGLRQLEQALGLTCHGSPNHGKRHCLLAVLRKGGRAVRLCKVVQRGTQLSVAPGSQLRVLPGTSPLKNIAVGWRLGGFRSEPQLFGRTAHNTLLALRKAPGSVSALNRRLIPEFDVDKDVSRERAGERLFIVGTVLVSAVPEVTYTKVETIAQMTEACVPSGSTELLLWDLATGAHGSRRLLGTGIHEQRLMQLLMDVCPTRKVYAADILDLQS